MVHPTEQENEQLKQRSTLLEQTTLAHTKTWTQIAARAGTGCPVQLRDVLPRDVSRQLPEHHNLHLIRQHNLL